MNTEQREVLDAVHVAWKAHSHLTFAKLLEQVLFPYTAYTNIKRWEELTNKEIEEAFVKYAIFD